MELILSNIEGEQTIPEAVKYILKNVKKENRDKLTKKLHSFINKNNREFIIRYNFICFDHACLNAKQSALKVYINMFYNEVGNSRFPFFSLPLAGGVTSANQRNIKLVTDLYPEEYFQECNTAYNNGNGISKEKYWNEMVKISIRVMGELRDKVNEFLKKDNRSTYLKMTYEEVLFLVVFIGKKKYYGIKHIKEPNFNPDPDKLFIRGINIVKRRQSKLFCKIDKEIIILYQIVEEVLKNTVKNSSQIVINECIQTYAWKSDKNNKFVKRFISQIKSNYVCEVKESKWLIKKGLVLILYLYNTSKPGKHFKCVVVEREDQYDSVIGLCTKFINSDKCFELPTNNGSLINITVSDEL
ncbi:hypothetical protein Glove_161g36 [Diversispora epigaea]|uniref:DNA-directed DNA polymerase n=1 Tax=Diversispora epigaea TaxID=1348612 RepID=A0A397IZV5_9GLOM|nr:hypothetical protein Glove_161g36 [Diversispora epigaea]